jgi:hypothetical protein
MRVNRALQTFGLDVRIALNSARGIRTYRSNRRTFQKQALGSRPNWEIGDAYPCLADRYDKSGVASGQYFHQDLYVAQQIFSARPVRHVDVGSRVDGFVAHVASFMPVEVIDIRPLGTSASNITFTQRDIMTQDPSFDDTTESLSCLHTLEHLGLGRYGDKVDFHGYLKGWDNLCRMVRPGGEFYFSVPISRWQRIEYDAHRLFGIPHLLEMIDPVFTIEAAAIVNDQGDLVRNVDVRSAAASRTFDINYGCIMFDLQKKKLH